MFRIVLACNDVPADPGADGAAAITEEFLSRPWHQNVVCSWDGQTLTLQADNDFDEKGLALMDEFSDAVSACVMGTFGYGIRLVSMARLAEACAPLPAVTAR
jgi:hypothetical protein